MATVNLTCDGGTETYYTSKVTSEFEAVYSLSGDLSITEGLPFGTGDRSAVGTSEVPCMNPNAYWIWNGINDDFVIFDLDLFPQSTTSPPTLQPATSPPTDQPATFPPTSAQTTTDQPTTTQPTSSAHTIPVPSAEPTDHPLTAVPTRYPTADPTGHPSVNPSSFPTDIPAESELSTSTIESIESTATGLFSENMYMFQCSIIIVHSKQYGNRRQH